MTQPASSSMSQPASSKAHPPASSKVKRPAHPERKRPVRPARKAQGPARKPKQLGFTFRTWGGKRRGAGRKPVGAGGVPHRRRPALASRYPVHLTLTVAPSLPGLRSGELPRLVKEGLRGGQEREGFRLVHYSIQPHHLHLMVEAASARALSRGVQGLAIRVAKGVNRALGRKGSVFADRYFARILRSPREVRSALGYVLNNARKHSAERGERLAWRWVDPHSSGQGFDGWRELSARPPLGGSVTVGARTWLLSVGWRRHGLLSVNEVPAGGG
jgi:hypothetical protein